MLLILNLVFFAFCLISCQCVLVHADNNANDVNQSQSCGCSGAGLTREIVDATQLISSKECSVDNQFESLFETSEESHENLGNGIELGDTDIALIPGGTFYMGLETPIIRGDGESPRRHVSISSFKLDKYEVSNAKFAEFVSATNYKTDSESYGWSFVFESAIPPHLKENIHQAVMGAEWWLPVSGASWREPEGPGSDVFQSNRSMHPVVHVSWKDSKAYCEWRGGRLPSEAEWEYAARGTQSLGTAMFPWGNKLTPKNVHQANVFQGNFPKTNTAEDGFEFLAPVDAFGPQNDFGLYNIIGNAWEWVEDWFTRLHDVDTAHNENPKGPLTGTERVQKGGSFLCHRSYCYRYRIVARHHSTPDSATLNTGFRCAQDA